MAMFRQIGIIGSGRVAQALALGLATSSGAPIRLWGRSADKAGSAAARVNAVAVAHLDRLTIDCDLIALAVSDDAVPSVTVDLARAIPIDGNTLVFHVSGRSGAAILDPLQAKGALTAAIHPAMTFTGDPVREARRMAEARFAITGSSDEAIARARQVVAMLGGVPVAIDEDRRTLYHAALCHASNHLVTLLTGASQALGKAGVDDPAALLAPLVRAALENSLDRGFGALSGPLLRGDERTIADHLATLDANVPDLLPAYRAMALATIDELERTGASENSGALRDHLK